MEIVLRIVAGFLLAIVIRFFVIPYFKNKWNMYTLRKTVRRIKENTNNEETKKLLQEIIDKSKED